MNIKKNLILLALLLILFLGFVLVYNNDHIELNKEEEDWLLEHDKIYYAGDPSWAPIDFKNSKGNPDGMAIDFLDLVGKKIGIDFIKINIGNWDETVEALKSKNVDVIAASFHPSRTNSMLFSPELYRIPYIYVVKNDFENILYNELINYRVASVEGWVLNDILKDSHPGIELIVYPTIKDALMAVSFGNVDVLIQEMASVSYEIEKENITNLKSGGEYPKSLSLHFAVRNDYEILYNIMSRAIEDISIAEKQKIISKWIRLNTISFYKTFEFKLMIGSVLFVVGFGLLWNYSLHRRVKSKTLELSNELHINDEIKSQLESSLEELKHTQREMLNQEKLASLGSMIAGITHEVSNPVSVCLTTISAFDQRIKDFQKLYDSNKMTKTALEHFLSFSDDCSGMLLINIDKSINLLTKFKNMAIDQMYEEKTMFNVGEYLSNLSENLKYELKKKQVSAHIFYNHDIFLNNNAGAFSQIFTNLIMNSIIHGFEESDGKNQIKIDITEDESFVLIKYSDNGIGISQDILADVFKLFFTTRHEEGGSGLGLHIVKNLLKNEFNGSINCESELGKGVLFNLRLNKIANNDSDELE